MTALLRPALSLCTEVYTFALSACLWSKALSELAWAQAIPFITEEAALAFIILAASAAVTLHTALFTGARAAFVQGPIAVVILAVATLGKSGAALPAQVSQALIDDAIAVIVQAITALFPGLGQGYTVPSAEHASLRSLCAHAGLTGGADAAVVRDVVDYPIAVIVQTITDLFLRVWANAHQAAI